MQTTVHLASTELGDALEQCPEMAVQGVLGPDLGYSVDMTAQMPALRGYRAVYTLRMGIKDAVVHVVKVGGDGDDRSGPGGAPARGSPAAAELERGAPGGSPVAAAAAPAAAAEAPPAGAT